MVKGIIHCHVDYVLKERSISLNVRVLSGYISPRNFTDSH